MLLQPAIMFVGEKFDTEQDFKQAKSMLLDMFRGQQVGDGGDAEPSVDAGSRQQLSLQPLVVTNAIGLVPSRLQQTPSCMLQSTKYGLHCIS